MAPPKISVRQLGPADIPTFTVADVVPLQSERSGRGSPTLLASASPVKSKRGDTAKKAPKRSATQVAAIQSHEVGPVGFATTWVGNVGSKLILEARLRNDDGMPIDLDEAVEDGLCTAAEAEVLRDEMRRFRDDSGGTETLNRKGFQNLFVAGDCYLVGTDPTSMLPDGAPDLLDAVESWEVRSILEVESSDDGLMLRDEPADATTNANTQGTRALKANQIAVRIWQPHPFANWRADSSVMRIIDSADELRLASADIRATAMSRLNAGVLFLSERIIGVARRAGESPAGEPDPDDETVRAELRSDIADLLDLFVEYASEPIHDISDPASHTPMLIPVPENLLATRPVSDLVHHLKFANDYSQYALEVGDRARRNIAADIDLPAEVLLGVADLNHWNAWQVDENSFSDHVEPRCVQWCAGLTKAIYRPALKARIAGNPASLRPEVYRRAVVWFDPSLIISNKTETGDAHQAFINGALGIAGYLEHLGFEESAQPEPEELLLRLVTSGKIRDAGILQALITALLYPELKVQTAERGQGSVVETSDSEPPVDGKGGSRGSPPKITAAPAAPGGGKPPAKGLTAAAPARLHLGQGLADRERRLRDRLTTAADAEVRRLLRAHGSALKAKMRGKELAAELSGVDREHAASRLAQHIGITEVFAAVAPPQPHDLQAPVDRWMGWVGQEQDAGNDDAHAWLAESGPGRDAEIASLLAALRVRQAQGRAAAADQLTRSLSDLITLLLEHPDLPAAELGEAGGDLLVGTSLIRSTLSMAGGDSVGEPIGPGGAVLSDPLLATVTALGASISAWTWRWGGALRPFEPHLSLDGVSELDLSSGRFAKDPAVFPYGSNHWHAGDHSGCTCDAVPTLITPDGAFTAAALGGTT